MTTLAIGVPTDTSLSIAHPDTVVMPEIPAPDIGLSI